MTILAHVHTYALNAVSGADKYLQQLLEYLSTRGIECIVAVDDCPNEYILSGVKVISNRWLLGEHYEAADLIMVHLVCRHESAIIAQRFGKPILHICNNHHTTEIQNASPFPNYIVYNSYWLQNSFPLPYESIVVNPVTRVQPLEDHSGQPYITLVNTTDNKGGVLWWNLAQALPQFKFLGVQGAYGHQMQQPLPNIMYRPHEAEMNYSDTKILLVPSKEESWSLCAAEAMARGIPVVCSNLPGLKENCGDAAIYCNTVRDYIEAIYSLMNPETYQHYSDAGKIRIASKPVKEQLNNLYNFVLQITGMKEKKEAAPVAVKEKKEIRPKKEKKEIKKP